MGEPNFIEQWQIREKEREEKEKAEWEALSETERQAILAERERLEKEQEAKRQAEQREKQLESWKRRGITKRYFEAEWGNWIADTPEKETAIKAARTAWKENLFLAGNHGTGKTYLAMCLAKEGATYCEASDIFREIRADFDKESETLDYYGNCKLLIIDEVGRQNKKELSDFEKNTFFEIINRRWNNCLPTMLISNMSVKDVSELLGAAILDRLRPIFVHFDWESMRGDSL
jgi:DNA replication protein DnaC